MFYQSASLLFEGPMSWNKLFLNYRNDHGLLTSNDASTVSEGWFPTTIKPERNTRFDLVRHNHFLPYEPTDGLWSSARLLQCFSAAPSFLSAFLA